MRSKNEVLCAAAGRLAAERSALQMNSYRTTGRMKTYLRLNVQTSLQFFELLLWLKLVSLGNLKQMLLGSFLKKILHNTI
jgi:hypothetical protein